MSKSSQRSKFPATRWSLVISSRGDDTVAKRALEQLCRDYWYPIYGFARGMGLSPNDAEDATQVFFQTMLDQDVMGRVTPSLGKLRSYMITTLKHSVFKTNRMATRAKRGGGAEMLSIDQEEAEGRFLREDDKSEKPDKAFDRRWAVSVLEAAMGRLEEDYKRRGERALFDQLNHLLAGVDRGKDYAEAAQALEMNEGAVRVAVFRLRKRYRAMVKSEIADTVSSPEEVEEELGALFESLS